MDDLTSLKQFAAIARAVKQHQVYQPAWTYLSADQEQYTVKGLIRDNHDHWFNTALDFAPEVPNGLLLRATIGDRVQKLSYKFIYLVNRANFGTCGAKAFFDPEGLAVTVSATGSRPLSVEGLPSAIMALFTDFETTLNSEDLWTALDVGKARICSIPVSEWEAA